MMNNPTCRITAVLMAIIMIGMALTACSGGARGGDAKVDTTPIPSSAPDATYEPIPGGALKLAMPVNAPCSDPLDVTTEEMLNLFSLVYDTLLTVGPSGEIEPCLCESWINEIPGTWILHLRDGVKWHDGATFSSYDVINTYNALVEMSDSYYKPCLKHIVSMDVIDSLTIRLKLDTPGILGLYSLVFPIKKAQQLMGTGAYRLESMTDESIVLRVNENWWDKQPFISSVIFVERDSNTTALASFEAGQLNLVPTDILTAGKYLDAGITNVYDIMTQDMETLLFNAQSRVFSNAQLRLAVAHGINRNRIITNVYMNRARAADVPIPPDNWLYDSRSAVLNYDPEASAQLIADAGYTITSDEDGLLYSKNGGSLRIKLLTSATTENTIRSDAAAIIASQLNSLGFNVEVVTASHTLGDSESEFITALKGGDWDIALVGFNLAMSNELSSYIAPDGENNFGHISDALLVSKANKIAEAENEEMAREAAYEFQTYFVETLPFFPLYFRLNSIICSANIIGPNSAREPLLFYDEKNWFITGD